MKEEGEEEADRNEDCVRAMGFHYSPKFMMKYSSLSRAAVELEA